ncbi:hypothetical protein [Paenibacillus larvae]|uniref:hypothetical protein n=1 Tax=Paenibacillus larvae TaxID=1464 RepID=UPI00288DC62F|nr:hypothetical protein [Paenibacillus larvae]MDT2194846.1 hypothetical protein [Paenibacillus larvae]
MYHLHQNRKNRLGNLGNHGNHGLEKLYGNGQDTLDDLNNSGKMAVNVAKKIGKTVAASSAMTFPISANAELPSPQTFEQTRCQFKYGWQFRRKQGADG